jgi:hypothetical protein
VLAHGRDRDAVDRGDIDLFNLELLLALDRAVEPLARLSDLSNQAVAFHLLAG